ncbi:11073_t:CDS:2 [Funneliformis mosseae]|uniref:11073_t:CDS:1 n=1 Tax=Funneliformis mosseae TaxID=27381 RepID=A0A9N8V905_FUNMO|nr:11073_t:CDS:2 [Funneliformis mosseae]
MRDKITNISNHNSKKLLDISCKPAESRYSILIKIGLLVPLEPDLAEKPSE